MTLFTIALNHTVLLETLLVQSVIRHHLFAPSLHWKKDKERLEVRELHCTPESFRWDKQLQFYLFRLWQPISAFWSPCQKNQYH